MMEYQWGENQKPNKVILNEKYRNQTCGLCGDFNGFPYYNEISEGGSMDQFVSNSLVKGPNENCFQSPVEKDAECINLNQTCQDLLESPEMSTCAAHFDISAFLEICNLGNCVCRDSTSLTEFCFCATITEYSRQCAIARGVPDNWRRPDMCAIKCPESMVYKECGTSCERSCSNQELLACDRKCVIGCFCPNGEIYPPESCYDLPCQHCNCTDGVWYCENKLCPGVCSVEGGSHFKTFDGRRYIFHADCMYILSQVCNNQLYTVHGLLEPCNQNEGENCLNKIVLALDDSTTVSNNITVFQPSTFAIIVETDIGVRLDIQLVPIMQVYIYLDIAYTGSTCGLCGNYNSNQQDDFKIPNGMSVQDLGIFTNSWKSIQSCDNVPPVITDPCTNNFMNEPYAQKWCFQMNSKSGFFSPCHSKVDPADYFTACLYDTCLCKNQYDCMCAVFSSYVRACAEQGVILNGWRNVVCGSFINLCDKSMEYQYVITSCQPTCKSLSKKDPSCDVKFTPIDGCVCKKDTYLRHDGQCVKKIECPCYYMEYIINPGEVINRDGVICDCVSNCYHFADCTAPMVYFNCSTVPDGSTGIECLRSCQNFNVACYRTNCVSGCICPYNMLADGRGGCVTTDNCTCIQNDRIYEHMATAKIGCSICTCNNRKWECEKNDFTAECTVYGEGNYITFDGKHYRYNGQCEYSLVQDFCGYNVLNGTFRIVSENTKCGTTGTTCSKSIKVFINDFMLVLSDGNVQVTNYLNQLDSPFQMRNTSMYLIITVSNGLILVWDKKTSLIIKVPQKFQNNICGLCGNYDGNSLNDFNTRGHAKVTDVMEFGNSWKLSPSCPEITATPEPCETSPFRKSWAQRKCNIILSNAFKPCHAEVDPYSYYDACVKDSCGCNEGGDCECFCTAVAMYAHACLAKCICVEWRTPDLCPVFCDFYNVKEECKWHYKACGANCMKTCRNPSGLCSEKQHKVEAFISTSGCYPNCPDNKPFFEEVTMQCVDTCGCYDQLGKYYPPGAKSVTCDVSYGLICNNRKQADGRIAVCFNYEISIYCCDTTCLSTTPPSTSTSKTQSTTTPLSTSTSRTVSTPTTTLSTTVTKTTSRLTSTPATSPATCAPVCSWSGWLDVSYPTFSENGGDFETYENIRKNGIDVCQKPQNIMCRAQKFPTFPNISCRAQKFPTFPVSALGQSVTCDVSYGLICNNKKQNLPQQHINCNNFNNISHNNTCYKFSNHKNRNRDKQLLPVPTAVSTSGTTKTTTLPSTPPTKTESTTTSTSTATSSTQHPSQQHLSTTAVSTSGTTKTTTPPTPPTKTESTTASKSTATTSTTTPLTTTTVTSSPITKTGTETTTSPSSTTAVSTSGTTKTTTPPTPPTKTESTTASTSTATTSTTTSLTTTPVTSSPIKKNSSPITKTGTETTTSPTPPTPPTKTESTTASKSTATTSTTTSLTTTTVTSSPLQQQHPSQRQLNETTTSPSSTTAVSTSGTTKKHYSSNKNRIYHIKHINCNNFNTTSLTTTPVTIVHQVLQNTTSTLQQKQNNLPQQAPQLQQLQQQHPHNNTCNKFSHHKNRTETSTSPSSTTAVVHQVLQKVLLPNSSNKKRIYHSKHINCNNFNNNTSLTTTPKYIRYYKKYYSPILQQKQNLPSKHINCKSSTTTSLTTTTVTSSPITKTGTETTTSPSSSTTVSTSGTTKTTTPPTKTESTTASTSTATTSTTTSLTTTPVTSSPITKTGTETKTSPSSTTAVSTSGTTKTTPPTKTESTTASTSTATTSTTTTTTTVTSSPITKTGTETTTSPSSTTAVSTSGTTKTTTPSTPPTKTESTTTSTSTATSSTTTSLTTTPVTSFSITKTGNETTTSPSSTTAVSTSVLHHENSTETTTSPSTTTQLVLSTTKTTTPKSSNKTESTTASTSTATTQQTSSQQHLTRLPITKTESTTASNQLQQLQQQHPSQQQLTSVLQKTTTPPTKTESTTASTSTATTSTTTSLTTTPVTSSPITKTGTETSTSPSSTTAVSTSVLPSQNRNRDSTPPVLQLHKYIRYYKKYYSPPPPTKQNLPQQHINCNIFNYNIPHNNNCNKFSITKTGTETTTSPSSSTTNQPQQFSITKTGTETKTSPSSTTAVSTSGTTKTTPPPQTKKINHSKHINCNNFTHNNNNCNNFSHHKNRNRDNNFPSSTTAVSTSVLQSQKRNRDNNFLQLQLQLVHQVLQNTTTPPTPPTKTESTTASTSTPTTTSLTTTTVLQKLLLLQLLQQKQNLPQQAHQLQQLNNISLTHTCKVLQSQKQVQRQQLPYSTTANLPQQAHQLQNTSTTASLTTTPVTSSPITKTATETTTSPSTTTTVSTSGTTKTTTPTTPPTKTESTTQAHHTRATTSPVLQLQIYHSSTSTATTSTTSLTTTPVTISTSGTTKTTTLFNSSNKNRIYHNKHINCNIFNTTSLTTTPVTSSPITQNRTETTTSPSSTTANLPQQANQLHNFNNNTLTTTTVTILQLQLVHQNLPQQAHQLQQLQHTNPSQQHCNSSPIKKNRYRDINFPQFYNYIFQSQKQNDNCNKFSHHKTGTETTTSPSSTTAYIRLQKLLLLQLPNKNNLPQQANQLQQLQHNIPHNDNCNKFSHHKNRNKTTTSPSSTTAVSTSGTTKTTTPPTKTESTTASTSTATTSTTTSLTTTPLVHQVLQKHYSSTPPTKTESTTQHINCNNFNNNIPYNDNCTVLQSQKQEQRQQLPPVLQLQNRDNNFPQYYNCIPNHKNRNRDNTSPSSNTAVSTQFYNSVSTSGTTKTTTTPSPPPTKTESTTASKSTATTQHTTSLTTTTVTSSPITKTGNRQTTSPVLQLQIYHSKHINCTTSTTTSLTNTPVTSFSNHKNVLKNYYSSNSSNKNRIYHSKQINCNNSTHNIPPHNCNILHHKNGTETTTSPVLQLQLVQSVTTKTTTPTKTESTTAAHQLHNFNNKIPQQNTVQVLQSQKQVQRHQLPPVLNSVSTSGTTKTTTTPPSKQTESLHSTSTATTSTTNILTTTTVKVLQSQKTRNETTTSPSSTTAVSISGTTKTTTPSTKTESTTASTSTATTSTTTSLTTTTVTSSPITKTGTETTTSPSSTTAVSISGTTKTTTPPTPSTKTESTTASTSTATTSVSTTPKTSSPTTKTVTETSTSQASTTATTETTKTPPTLSESVTSKTSSAITASTFQGSTTAPSITLTTPFNNDRNLTTTFYVRILFIVYSYLGFLPLMYRF
ncbi:hypothetical protein GDO86_008698 [Hymenochirus boettgeri]|uniref:VWFD domain-containing protein n=1 Tax=Hymenochirus boettgeri TaxID=247094 RepID=A0A8T2J6S0_9PIPI|nr:hypothetical protein GDO86_008698 [Hymenochirus boettgeri]